LNLHTITYTSSAVAAPSAEEIDHLLRKARSRNEQELVTGVLLYADGTFLQYLEGPLAGLERVYAAILRDPLHHQIFEMIREPIERREFDEWTMGYRGTAQVAGTTDDDALMELLTDESHMLSPGRLLLNAFWSKGLGARYRAALAAGQGAQARHPGRDEARSC
jgi:hypothetical protein